MIGRPQQCFSGGGNGGARRRSGRSWCRDQAPDPDCVRLERDGYLAVNEIACPDPGCPDIEPRDRSCARAGRPRPSRSPGRWRRSLVRTSRKPRPACPPSRARKVTGHYRTPKVRYRHGACIGGTSAYSIIRTDPLIKFLSCSFKGSPAGLRRGLVSFSHSWTAIPSSGRRSAFPVLVLFSAAAAIYPLATGSPAAAWVRTGGCGLAASRGTSPGVFAFAQAVVAPVIRHLAATGGYCARRDFASVGAERR